jgi:hypothetical protein
VNKDSWAGCIGVDNNRNWDFHWNEGGSSPNTCDDAYMGTFILRMMMMYEG